MDVEMEGSYTQLVSFLAFMSKIQRIVNIRGLELKLKDYVDDVPILKMKGTFVAYRYVEGQ
jgi:Tfp pilus assembly protein PilO